MNANRKKMLSLFCSTASKCRQCSVQLTPNSALWSLTLTEFMKPNLFQSTYFTAETSIYGDRRSYSKRSTKKDPTRVNPERSKTEDIVSENPDGEEIARKNLGPEEEPQIQADWNCHKSSRTSGGSYSNRDDPKAQASPPTDGKTDEQIIKEQTAGPPETLKTKEDQSAAPKKSFADEAIRRARMGMSSLGQYPSGVE